MTQASIASWFPTFIYRNSLVAFSEMKESFVCRAYEIKEKYPNSKSKWNCDTYNTQNVYNLIDDEMFKGLVKACEQEVQKFATEFGVMSQAKCVDAWLNISKDGQYQEYHVHPGRHFSLVYYVKTPVNCGNIRFKSPSADTDMFLLPISDFTNASYSTCYYEPEENVVLIFRSNLQHMVETNKSNEDRISIAMNFLC
jgi:uncharacterized protein (TIGR02466 family)